MLFCTRQSREPDFLHRHPNAWRLHCTLARPVEMLHGKKEHSYPRLPFILSISLHSPAAWLLCFRTGRKLKVMHRPTRLTRTGTMFYLSNLRGRIRYDSVSAPVPRPIKRAENPRHSAPGIVSPREFLDTNGACTVIEPVSDSGGSCVVETRQQRYFTGVCTCHPSEVGSRHDECSEECSEQAG
jgi:hypothetical protein